MTQPNPKNEALIQVTVDRKTIAKMDIIAKKCNSSRASLVRFLISECLKKPSKITSLPIVRRGPIPGNIADRFGFWVYGQKNKTGLLDTLVVQEVSLKRSIDGTKFFPYTKGNDKMRDKAYRKAETYANVTAAQFQIPNVKIRCLGDL